MPVLRARVMVKRNGVPLRGFPVTRRVETPLAASAFQRELSGNATAPIVPSTDFTTCQGFALVVDGACVVDVGLAPLASWIPLNAGGFIMVINSAIATNPHVEIGTTGPTVMVRGGHGGA